MAIKFVSISEGVALTSSVHPKGPGMKRGRPTKEAKARREAAVETVEIEIQKAPAGLKVTNKFDRVAYQKAYMRDYMRKYRRRKAEKEQVK
jgi:hypothetical protein